jgi:AraC-like DNA-binding protein
MVERGPLSPLLLGYAPQIEPLVVPTAPGVTYRGIRIAAEAGPLLFGVDADALVAAPVHLDHLGQASASDIANALREGPPERTARALDELFLPVVEQLPATDVAAAAALELIVRSQGRQGLADIAEALGLSSRTLLRRVKGATGLTPKQHARIARFFAAAQGMLNPAHRLSDLAASGGYADQPHFHHEVTALTGLTPAELAERVRRTEHRLD